MENDDVTARRRMLETMGLRGLTVESAELVELNVLGVLPRSDGEELWLIESVMVWSTGRRSRRIRLVIVRDSRIRAVFVVRDRELATLAALVTISDHGRGGARRPAAGLGGSAPNASREDASREDIADSSVREQSPGERLLGAILRTVDPTVSDDDVRAMSEDELEVATAILRTGEVRT